MSTGFYNSGLMLKDDGAGDGVRTFASCFQPSFTAISSGSLKKIFSKWVSIQSLRLRLSRLASWSMRLRTRGLM